jgi:hypothetical protein
VTDVSHFSNPRILALRNIPIGKLYHTNHLSPITEAIR